MAHETTCVKIKLKPGSMDKVREWADTINSRVDEAMATLDDEGVILECAFLDQTSEGDFLIYVMKAKSFEHAKRVAENSTHAIDLYHQEFKAATWEDGSRLETLIDLENFE